MLDLLTALRRATDDAHQALHAHPLLVACLADRLDEGGYRRMLQAFYAPWQTFLPRVGAVPLRALQPGLIHRAQALRADLTTLGIDPPTAEEPGHKLPAGEDALLGACYVLVGSSLGATLLRAHVKAALPTAPHAYFSISPREAGWPLLLAHLRTLAARHHPTALPAANGVFQHIQTALSSPA